MQFMPSFIYQHLMRIKLVNRGSLFYVRTIGRHFPPLHSAVRVCGQVSMYDIQAVASNMSQNKGRPYTPIWSTVTPENCSNERNANIRARIA